MNVLPPLPLLKKWREEEGLSPEEIYKRCKELYQEVYKRKLQPVNITKYCKPKVRHTCNTRKLPDTTQLIELYKTHSLREIARMYGVHHQTISNWLRPTGIIEERRIENAKQKRHLKEQTEIQRKEKLINCPKCKIKPYARGLCRLCYNRLRENRLSPEDRELIQQRIESPKRPGVKRKPETIQKVQIIRQMKEQGKSIKEIAEIVNLKESSCYGLLKRYERS